VVVLAVMTEWYGLPPPRSTFPVETSRGYIGSRNSGDYDKIVERRLSLSFWFDAVYRLESRAEFCDPFISGTLDLDPLGRGLNADEPDSHVAAATWTLSP